MSLAITTLVVALILTVTVIPPVMVYCTIYPVMTPLRSVQLTSSHAKLTAVELIVTGVWSNGAPLGGSVDGNRFLSTLKFYINFANQFLAMKHFQFASFLRLIYSLA